MMGYSKGFVASIILKNKPLREFKYGDRRTVKVPYGSEYVIRLKNKTADPALVEVSIDGTDVLNGSDLVLKAGQTFDLERFVESNLKGKKLKYISLEEGASSGEIDDPFREDNGLVKVKFHKAYKLSKRSLNDLPFCGAVINHDYFLKGGPTVQVNDISYSSTSRQMSFDSNSDIQTNFFSSSVPENKGATVEGSDSSQSFSNTSDYYRATLEAEVDIYMVGPNYVEKEVAVSWGVYKDEDSVPIAKFQEKKHAHLFAGNLDLGESSILVKLI